MNFQTGAVKPEAERLRRIRVSEFFYAVIAAGMLSACTIEMITPTVRPTNAATVTPELPLASLLPTIAAEPTETATIPPTVTPDVLRPAEAGQRIFHDALDNSDAGWSVATTSAGTVDFSSGMLVFALKIPYTSLVSELSVVFPADVYIEATVQTLLCGEGWETFGIIFRNGKEYSYRYAVTCFGQLRFERYKGTSLDGPSAWRETLGLLQGAPATNRIGVLIQGRLFRFFVGGIEVFAGQDPMSDSGGAGLFIRTDKSGVFSVGFDDFSVYALNESP
ncbi:MAG: hypothetical protein JW929_02550 [Anaerolineales bacterium]|nr:hypothetical protein [Anaerolineales bacterium]